MANKREFASLKAKKNQTKQTIGRISRFVMSHKDDIFSSKLTEQFLARSSCRKVIT